MKILLAVSGSIAAYKSYDLARLLFKEGHEIRVVLTKGALEFIKPETFRYLGVENVYLPQEDFDPERLSVKSTVLHIELAKWADKLIIAPLSANTLSRLNLGLNNDLLGSIYLAFGKKPILLFPAMNTEMLQHPRTQVQLKEMNAHPHIGVISPDAGLLACGDIGAGKFPDVTAVKDLIESYNPIVKIDKTVIVTAGATASPLDPVRYLTNPSTGRMGKAVAKAFLQDGYKVVLLKGHGCTSEIENLMGHPNFTLVSTPTTGIMKEAALKYFPDSSLYVSTGAIADIEFNPSASKMKKEEMKEALPFKKAADILQEVLKLKKPNQKIISFAAETETSEKVFREKMTRKPVDLMVGNRVSSGLIGDETLKGFSEENSEFFLVGPQKTDGPYPWSKTELARHLVKWFQGVNP